MLRILKRFRETAAEITDYYGRKLCVSNAVSGMVEVKYRGETLYFDTAEMKDLIDALYSKSALDRREEKLVLHGRRIRPKVDVVSESAEWPDMPELVNDRLERLEKEYGITE